MREIDYVLSQIWKISNYSIPPLLKYAWKQDLAHSCKLWGLLWYFLCTILQEVRHLEVKLMPLGMQDDSCLAEQGRGWAHTLHDAAWHFGHRGQMWWGKATEAGTLLLPLLPKCCLLWKEPQQLTHPADAESSRDSFCFFPSAQSSLFWPATDTQSWYLMHRERLPSFSSLYLPSTGKHSVC